MGVRYATGQGVPRDSEEAARWYRLAAAQGHAVAQFNLALLYVHGQGVEQDYVQAYLWFSLSAEQGDELAAESRDRVAEALSPEDCERAREQVRKTLREIAERKIHPW
jgi:TPR repeat protein